MSTNLINADTKEVLYEILKAFDFKDAVLLIQEMVTKDKYYICDVQEVAFGMGILEEESDVMHEYAAEYGKSISFINNYRGAELMHFILFAEYCRYELPECDVTLTSMNEGTLTLTINRLEREYIRQSILRHNCMCEEIIAMDILTADEFKVATMFNHGDIVVRDLGTRVLLSHTVVSDTVCDECIRCTQESVGTVDQLLHQCVWSHGIATGFGYARSIDSTIDNLNGICTQSHWRVCCAHKSQHIGYAGVYIRGTVNAVSNRDLCSVVGLDNERYCLKSNPFIFAKEEIDFSMHTHMEAILTDYTVVGLWIYRETIEQWPKLYAYMKTMNLKIHIIEA